MQDQAGRQSPTNRKLHGQMKRAAASTQRRQAGLLRYLPWALLLGAGLALGCSQKQKSRGEESPAVVDPKAERRDWLANESAPITAEILEQFVVALKDCSLNDRGIDPRCEAFRELKKARMRRTPPSELASINDALGKKLLRHESPAVRWQAVQLVRPSTSNNPENQGLLLAAVREEKEPAVLVSLVRSLGLIQKDNPEIQQQLLQLAEHSSAQVRQEALGWLLTPQASGIKGFFEKVIEHLENDESIEVRRFLCSRLYASQDERAIPLFEKYLSEETPNQQLFEGCFQGVISAWTGFPKPHKPNKAAYELTLKLLEKKPRTKNLPPWNSFRNLRAAKTEFVERDRSGKAWLEEVKPFFDQKRLIRALEDIVVDRNTSWMTRNAALDVLRDLGAPEARFQAWLKQYEGAEGDDLHVLRKLQEGNRRSSHSGIMLPKGMQRPDGARGEAPEQAPPHPEAE